MTKFKKRKKGLGVLNELVKMQNRPSSTKELAVKYFITLKREEVFRMVELSATFITDFDPNNVSASIPNYREKIKEGGFRFHEYTTAFSVATTAIGRIQEDGRTTLALNLQELIFNTNLNPEGILKLSLLSSFEINKDKPITRKIVKESQMKLGEQLSESINAAFDDFIRGYKEELDYQRLVEGYKENTIQNSITLISKENQFFQSRNTISLEEVEEVAIKSGVSVTVARDVAKTTIALFNIAGGLNLKSHSGYDLDVWIERFKHHDNVAIETIHTLALLARDGEKVLEDAWAVVKGAKDHVEAEERLKRFTVDHIKGSPKKLVEAEVLPVTREEDIQITTTPVTKEEEDVWIPIPLLEEHQEQIHPTIQHFKDNGWAVCHDKSIRNRPCSRSEVEKWARDNGVFRAATSDNLRPPASTLGSLEARVSLYYHKLSTLMTFNPEDTSKKLDSLRGRIIFCRCGGEESCPIEVLAKVANDEMSLMDVSTFSGRIMAEVQS